MVLPRIDLFNISARYFHFAPSTTSSNSLTTESGGHFLAQFTDKFALPVYTEFLRQLACFKSGSSGSSMILVFFSRAGLCRPFAGGMLRREPSSSGNPNQNPNLRRRNQVAPRPFKITALHFFTFRLTPAAVPFFLSCRFAVSLCPSHTHTTSRYIALCICVNICCLKPLPPKNNSTDCVVITLIAVP